MGDRATGRPSGLHGARMAGRAAASAHLLQVWPGAPALRGPGLFLCLSAPARDDLLICSVISDNWKEFRNVMSPSWEPWRKDGRWLRQK